MDPSPKLQTEALKQMTQSAWTSTSQNLQGLVDPAVRSSLACLRNATAVSSQMLFMWCVWMGGAASWA